MCLETRKRAVPAAATAGGWARLATAIVVSVRHRVREDEGKTADQEISDEPRRETSRFDESATAHQDRARDSTEPVSRSGAGDQAPGTHSLTLIRARISCTHCNRTYTHEAASHTVCDDCSYLLFLTRMHGGGCSGDGCSNETRDWCQEERKWRTGVCIMCGGAERRERERREQGSARGG